MKGILNKTNRGWVVKQVVKEGPDAKLINQYPLVDNGHIDGLKLYDSNEGLEVDFDIVTDYDNNGPDHFPKYAKIITPEEAELKDWDVTLNDGLENEPYEYVEDTTPREKAKSELINLLLYQIMDLTTMSKIELGDDVIAEIKRLKDIIKIGEQEIEKVMTPREKASELVDKFSNKCLLTTDGGKVAALIAVDEIIKECYNWNGSDNVQWETKRFDYWNEVKQEIEKL